MLIGNLANHSQLNKIIDKELTPFVRKIDQEAYYAKHYIERLGQEKYFFAKGQSESEIILNRVQVIEETAEICMTTAFCVWCHFAAITYLSHTKNSKLYNFVLPKLLSGELLAGTGLSNPLKYFAKLEKLHLKAERIENGYLINGALPAVSNIGKNHAFAFIAELDYGEQIMGFTLCDVEGLTLNERIGYLGVNGSATFSCTFNNVFIADESIISANANEFVQKIRPQFLTYQIPLGIGVITSCINSLEKIAKRQSSVNRHLRIQPEHLREKNKLIRNRLYEVVTSNDLCWEKLLSIRLDMVYLTLSAVQTMMIHHGGRGYVKTSSASRKLREAYFLVNLTPTVKHLEKVINS